MKIDKRFQTLSAPVFGLKNAKNGVFCVKNAFKNGGILLIFCKKVAKTCHFL